MGDRKANLDVLVQQAVDEIAPRMRIERFPDAALLSSSEAFALAKVVVTFFDQTREVDPFRLEKIADRKSLPSKQGKGLYMAGAFSMMKAVYPSELGLIPGWYENAKRVLAKASNTAGAFSEDEADEYPLVSNQDRLDYYLGVLRHMTEYYKEVMELSNLQLVQESQPPPLLPNPDTVEETYNGIFDMIRKIPDDPNSPDVDQLDVIVAGQMVRDIQEAAATINDGLFDSLVESHPKLRLYVQEIE